jgi:hypothetical protein
MAEPSLLKKIYTLINLYSLVFVFGSKGIHNRLENGYNSAKVCSI